MGMKKTRKATDGNPIPFPYRAVCLPMRDEGGKEKEPKRVCYPYVGSCLI